MTYFPKSLHYKSVTSVEPVAATDAQQLRYAALPSAAELDRCAVALSLFAFSTYGV
jgi:hypothetical protein